MNAMHYRSAPLTELVDKLEGLITTRPGRAYHYLPDLALKMLATQVARYARAFQCLEAGRFVSWSFPIARAAFEAAEDLAYLAFAPTPEVYDRRGALAHLGAELSISRSFRLAREAAPERPAREPLPQKKRVQVLIDEWSRFRDDAEGIMWSAYEDAKLARRTGINSWTLLARNDTHEDIQANLQDPNLGKVLRSWYDLLSDRSHPALHSPQLDRHSRGHTLLVDADEDHKLPPASVRYALILAIHALEYQYGLWDSDPDAP